MSGIVNSAGSRSGVIGTTEIDYEEGTFVPYFNQNSGAASGTQAGSYTKIGNLVTIVYTAQSTNLTTTYGGAHLYIPLPFMPKNGDRNRTYADWYFQNGTAHFVCSIHCNGDGVNSKGYFYGMTAANTDATGSGTPVSGTDSGSLIVLVRGTATYLV